jgi:transcriptional regulator with XRE-family HTH domain
MDKNLLLIHIRNKKLGVLIHDARLASHHSITECADAMGVSADKFLAIENGKVSPSLPELEALAFSLNIPLEHFWGHESMSEKQLRGDAEKQELLREIRNKFLATRLRQARNEANITLKDLSDKTAISEEILQQYESANISIPLPELEIIAQSLNLRIEDIFDKDGPIGEWRFLQQSVNYFLELPPRIQQFVAKPVNAPYLELAVRLSDLSVEKLRAVAEGLLEITY